MITIKYKLNFISWIKVNLFSQILANISREKFDTLKKHQSDKHNKGLKSWTHLVSMLFCHIGGACSVRDISNGLSSTGKEYVFLTNNFGRKAKTVADIYKERWHIEVCQKPKEPVSAEL